MAEQSLKSFPIQPFKIPEQPNFADIILKSSELEIAKRGQLLKEQQNLTQTMLGFTELVIKNREAAARNDMAKAMMELRLANEAREKELHPLKKVIAERRAAGQPTLTVGGVQLFANLENAEKSIDRIVSIIEQSPSIMSRATTLGVARAKEYLLGQKPALVRDIDDLSDLITFLRTGAQRGEKEVARITGFIEPKILNPKDVNIKNLLQVKANLTTLKTKLSSGVLESSPARLDAYGLGGFSPQTTPAQPILNLDITEPEDFTDLGP